MVHRSTLQLLSEAQVYLELKAFYILFSLLLVIAAGLPQSLVKACERVDTVDKGTRFEGNLLQKHDDLILISHVPL